MSSRWPVTIIVDSGLGNVTSVANMVNKAGGNALISSDKKAISSASKLILPGVGAFDYGIQQLHERELFTSMQERAVSRTPILGICLGMQLLGRSSEEGKMDGLGIVDIDFKLFKFNQEYQLRVPHVGWNNINVLKETALLPVSNNEQRFYFSHSYYAVCSEQEEVIATADYGFEFPVVYHRNNVFGVQFHPEKSHRFGMALMKNFLNI